MEPTFITEILEYGPLYATIVLGFTFFVTKFWPWWSGPHQEEIERRKLEEIVRTTAVTAQVNDLTSRVLTMIEKQQNGLSTDMGEIKAMLKEESVASRLTLDNLTAAISNRTGQVDRMLDLLLKEMQEK